MKIKPFFVLGAWFLVSALRAFSANPDDAAKTYTTDGSLSDTQTAVDYVDAKNEDGWVITVGSVGGSYTWTGQLTVSIEHAVTIQGASPSNRPTITSTYSGDPGISVTFTDGKLVTFKDFIFADFSASDALFGCGGSGDDTYRFTNILFNHTTYGTKCIRFGSSGGQGTLTTGADGPYGVIDNCTVSGGGAAFYFYAVGQNWQRAMTWGTKSSHFIEDCIFYYNNPGNLAGPATDGWNGMRLVFRNNTLTNIYANNHGPDTAGTLNSALQMEFRRNSFTSNDTIIGLDTFILLKGGSAVVTGNTFTVGAGGYVGLAVKLEYQRATGSAPGQVMKDRFYTALSTTIAAGSNGASLPQGTINVASTAALGAAVSIGNGNFQILVTTSNGVQTVTCTGLTSTSFLGCSGGTGTMSTGGAVTRASDYVGTMQPGTGYIGTTGSDPNWPSEPWGVVPIYNWGNTLSGTFGSGEIGGDTAGFSVDGRDYYSNTAKPGDVEYTYPHSLRGVAGTTATVSGTTTVSGTLTLP